MKIGVIGLRDGWSTESLSSQLQKKQAGGEIIELQELSYSVSSGTFTHPTLDPGEFDAFILKKMGREYSPHLLDQLELLETMEEKGFRFFSSPAKIRRMISRLSCTLHLSKNNIPMPPTFISQNVEDAVSWACEQAPVILKPLYSTKARGMAMLTDEESARFHITALIAKGEKIIYLQKKYDIAGSDYGLVFLGGAYLGAYARVADGSTWHTTTREGGKYAAYTPSEETIELARKAQSPFGLDFTCVDIANTTEVGPVVFEVSAFGGYKGLYKSSGVDASDLLTDHVIARLNDES